MIFRSGTRSRLLSMNTKSCTYSPKVSLASFFPPLLTVATASSPASPAASTATSAIFRRISSANLYACITIPTNNVDLAGACRSSSSHRWMSFPAPSRNVLKSSIKMHLRPRLFQPVRHPHLAVHRRRGGEVLLCLLALARAPVQLAETEVTVRDEGTHAAWLCERERLAV